MPIYEYQCTSCHHHFDLMQKINEVPATQCPKCSDHSVIKLISAAGFQLKGTGWYATDYKNKGNPEIKNSDKKEESTVSTNTATTGSTANKETAASSPSPSTTSKGEST